MLPDTHPEPAEEPAVAPENDAEVGEEEETLPFVFEDHTRPAVQQALFEIKMARKFVEHQRSRGFLPN